MTNLVVKEIAPRSISGATLVLFGTFLGIGDELVYILIYFIKPEKDPLLINIFFFMPFILSTLQLILCFTIFKYDTPRQLYEEKMEEDSLGELNKIYSSVKTRMKVHDKIKTLVDYSKRQYPRYSDLIKGNNLKQLLKGMAMVVIRNFNGLFMIMTFGHIIFKGKFENYAKIILFIPNIFSTIVPFLLIDSTSYHSLSLRKKPLTSGR